MFSPANLIGKTNIAASNGIIGQMMRYCKTSFSLIETFIAIRDKKEEPLPQIDRVKRFFFFSVRSNTFDIPYAIR
jgi:hypothetical protein